MATIALEKAEIFEHFHAEESTTFLVTGTVELEMAGRKKILNRDEPVIIPANTSHTLRNIGGEVAIVGCGHS